MGGQYDSSKEKVFASKSIEIDEKTTIDVAVKNYDGGVPKVSVSRTVKYNGKEQYRPLGWLTPTEIEKLLPVLKQMAAVVVELLAPKPNIDPILDPEPTPEPRPKKKKKTEVQEEPKTKPRLSGLARMFNG